MFFIDTIRIKNAQAKTYLHQERLYQYGKAMEQARILYPGYSGADLLDATAGLLVNSIFSENQKCLLRMFHGNELRQQELDRFLNGWDIETVQSGEAMLFACLQKEHPNLDFGDRNGPRLNGLRDYCKFHSLDLMFHFSRILSAFNAEGIFPMLLNTSPLYSRHPELFGMKRKLEMLLPDEVYVRLAEKNITELGYICQKNKCSLTVCITGKTTECKVAIFPFTAFTGRSGECLPLDVFQRASKENLFHGNVLLPCTEDRIVLLLRNIAVILRTNCNRQELLFAVAGLVDLVRLQKDADLKHLREDLRRSGAAAECLLSVYFVNRIIPGLIPEELGNNTECLSRINKLIESDDKYIQRAYGNTLSRQYSVVKSRLAARLQNLHFSRHRK